MAIDPTEGITIADIVTVLGIIVAVGGIWYRAEGKLNKSTDAALSKAAEAITALNEFKLEVAKGYASLKHIEDVEERLVSAINKLDASMRALPSQISTIVNTVRDRAR